MLELKRSYIHEMFEIEAIGQRIQMQGKKLNWNTLFNTESDLIHTLEILDLQKLDILIKNNCIKGYGYILGFTKQLQNNKSLSEAQIKQSKRLALEIYKAEKLIKYVEEA